MDFTERTVGLYLAAIVSPDVRFHKLGCVELLSLVSFIQVPWDSILFKSIPEREIKIYILQISNLSQGQLLLVRRGSTCIITRNLNDV